MGKRVFGLIAAIIMLAVFISLVFPSETIECAACANDSSRGF